MVQRRENATRTSRRLERALEVRKRIRNNHAEKCFRKLFEKVESEKLESILKNNEKHSISMSRTLAWIRSITHYNESILDGTHIPSVIVSTYIRRILKEREPMKKNLDSKFESMNVIGMQQALERRLPETCPIIEKFLKHEDPRLRSRAAFVLGKMKYTEAIIQLTIMSKLDKKISVRTAAQSAVRQLIEIQKIS